MIDYKYKELFEQDSVRKELKIEYDGNSITNEDIFYESMEIQESLCSDSELRFGRCEASSFKIKIANHFTSMIGKWLTVSTILNGNTDVPFVFGKYKVQSDVPTADRSFREIVAYDAMYDVLQANVVDWYDKILPNDKTTVTLKAFRRSFWQLFGIEEEDTNLINDDIKISRTVSADTISGKDMANYICEINGVFGHIGRNGKLQYKELKLINTALYPSDDLYPNNDVFPSNTYNLHKLKKSQYQSATYEDFKTKNISKLVIRDSEKDQGYIQGTDATNTYIIQGNILLMGQSDSVLETVSKRLLDKIKIVAYRPSNVVAKGNPCLEVGDGIEVASKYKLICTYILNRTIKGIQALKDTYESKGVENYSEKVNGVMYQVSQLKGVTRELEQATDSIRSEITTIQDGQETMQNTIEQNQNSTTLAINNLTTQTNSKIEQTSSAITAEVTRASNAEQALSTRVEVTENGLTSTVKKGDVSSQISQEAGAVSIKANRFSWESTNSSLAQDGSMAVKDIAITGGSIDLTATNNAETKIKVHGSAYGVEINPYQSIYKSNSSFVAVGINGITGGTYSGTDYSTENYFNILNGVLRAQGNGSTSYIQNLVIGGNFSVSGSKSRDVHTANYETRLLYCYETPSPMFGDLGEGQIDDTGKCYVYIDEVFSETIDTECQYQVFIQPYGDGKCWVDERNSAYFVICGTPNIKFGWEMKAIQRDYDSIRLDEFDREKELNSEITDYVTDIYSYLQEQIYNPEKETFDFIESEEI